MFFFTGILFASKLIFQSNKMSHPQPLFWMWHPHVSQNTAEQRDDRYLPPPQPLLQNRKVEWDLQFRVPFKTQKQPRSKVMANLTWSCWLVDGYEPNYLRNPSFEEFPWKSWESLNIAKVAPQNEENGSFSFQNHGTLDFTFKILPVTFSTKPWLFGCKVSKVHLGFQVSLLPLPVVMDFCKFFSMSSMSSVGHVWKRFQKLSEHKHSTNIYTCTCVYIYIYIFSWSLEGAFKNKGPKKQWACSLLNWTVVRWGWPSNLTHPQILKDSRSTFICKASHEENELGKAQQKEREQGPSTAPKMSRAQQAKNLQGQAREKTSRKGSRVKKETEEPAERPNVGVPDETQQIVSFKFLFCPTLPAATPMQGTSCCSYSTNCIFSLHWLDLLRMFHTVQLEHNDPCELIQVSEKTYAFSLTFYEATKAYHDCQVGCSTLFLFSRLTVHETLWNSYRPSPWPLESWKYFPKLN